MWICSTLGFYSIVCKGPGPGWQVRARTETDLANLIQAAGLGSEPIIHTPHADYAWRIAIDQRRLGKVFAAFQRSIDYPNFKSEVGCRRDQCDKLPAYHSFWSDMISLQKG